MEKPKPTTPESKASRTWEHLEEFVREHVQQFIQVLLEEEITELLGRTKSARREAVDPAPRYRNGYGKPRRLTLTSGTLTVRRPRVRDLNERFASRWRPRAEANALPSTGIPLRVSAPWSMFFNCVAISTTSSRAWSRARSWRI